MNHVNRAVRHIIGKHSAPLVKAFYDSRNRFAGSTFETLQPNEADRFSASDLLAASLLDISFLPRAVRELLVIRPGEFNALLKPIPLEVDLWGATDEDLATAEELWRLLRSLKGMGMGPTHVSKLIARKRPRLIPVIDSVVRNGLGIGREDNSWFLLREALAEDDALVDRVEELRPKGLTHEVSTLRLLDSALWMNLSRSVHVVSFRQPAESRET